MSFHLPIDLLAYIYLFLYMKGGSYMVTQLGYKDKLSNHWHSIARRSSFWRVDQPTYLLFHRDSCSYFRYTAEGNLQEEACTEFHYDDSIYSSTLTSEVGGGRRLEKMWLKMKLFLGGGWKGLNQNIRCYYGMWAKKVSYLLSYKLHSHWWRILCQKCLVSNM